MAADEEAAELVAVAPDETALRALVDRRVSGEPLAWITGTARFCGLELLVDPGVYVPRWQSEALARRGADLLPAHGTAVDLCTGSGAVALVMQTARPAARVVATERNPLATACARRNGVDVLEGHLFDPLPQELARVVDVLVGVVPYVPDDALHLLPRDVVAFEPLEALAGGITGLEVVDEVVATSPRWVRPGGWLLLEVGGDQVEVTQRRFTAGGYVAVSVLTDGDGDPRGVAGRRRS
ncbi:MAG TPA: HemK/PrmC family methyltransferase [Acidimicrobiales bacterium]